MRDLPSKELERKRALVDHSITSETRQPTVEGKPCRYCDSTVKFTKRKGTCVRCHKQWRRDYEIKSSKYSNSLYRKLGITREAYYQACEDQNWRCLICKVIPPLLVVDHCHSEGHFRGLLCQQCNSGLGFFKDNAEHLRAAIEYLRA